MNSIQRAVLLVFAANVVAGILLPAAFANMAAWPSSARTQTRQQRTASAEAALQEGILLTQQGRFSEAIPHFVKARGHVRDEYAANFNLALCYVATKQSAEAIPILKWLKATGQATPAVNNLLTQAYIAEGNDAKASRTFAEAVKQTPRDERLYLFIADACLDRGAYDFGLRALNLGIKNLPRSARLHYQRGVFLSFENDPDGAVADFELAEDLAPDTGIAYMAAGQKALLEGNVAKAIRITHEGLQKGHKNYVLLAIFGDAVSRSGARPGDPEFSEAEAALKESIAEHPSYGDSHAILGELYLSGDDVDDAITELQQARELDPGNASVYSHLAIAYRRKGNLQAAEQMLGVLAKLNQQQVEKYKGTPGGVRAGYISSGRLPH